MDQVCFMVWVYTLWAKKTVPQIEFTAIFESLKYNYRILDAYTSINFKQSVEVLLKSME